MVPQFYNCKLPEKLTPWGEAYSPLDTVPRPAPVGFSPAAGRGHLSLDHISTEAKISYANGGRFARLRYEQKGYREDARPSIRGEIRGFSSDSRHRLLALVNSIDQRVSSPSEYAFVTLTYPKEYPTVDASKLHLDRFIKQFERAFGNHWLLWKLEPQVRGAPHYHCLVRMGTSWDIQALNAWVASEWHRIVESDDPNHLKFHLGQLGNRPCVETVKDWKGVTCYAGKYLAKTFPSGQGEWRHPGRFWGERRHELAAIAIVEKHVSLKAAAMIRRTIRRWAEHRETSMIYVCGKKNRPGHTFTKTALVESMRKSEPWGTTCSPNDTAAIISWLARYDITARVQRRRLRRSRAFSGLSDFVASADVERLLAWAGCTSPPGSLPDA